jgi:2-dehydro-3-deoxygluconokinase
MLVIEAKRVNENAFDAHEFEPNELEENAVETAPDFSPGIHARVRARAAPNYRAKLWSSVGGPERAQEVLRRIAGHVDALIGNEEDLQLGLGIPGPEVAAKSKLDPSAFLGMIDNVIRKHPQIKVVATTLREVHSTNRHSWSAVAWINGKTFNAPTCELDVLDRVGGGDGFAAGFFYGWLNGESEAEALNLGWAHGALLTTFPGDTTMATLEQVRAFAKGGSARIQR